MTAAAGGWLRAAQPHAVVLNRQAQPLAPGGRQLQVERAVFFCAATIARGVANGLAGGAEENFSRQRGKLLQGAFGLWRDVPGNAVEVCGKFGVDDPAQRANEAQ